MLKAITTRNPQRKYGDRYDRIARRRGRLAGPVFSASQETLFIACLALFPPPIPRRQRHLLQLDLS